MQGYTTFKKKKSKLGTTLLIVAAVHLLAGGGLVWLASTTAGREILAVYKIDMIPDIMNIGKPKPPSPKSPDPAPSGAEPAGPASSEIASPAPEAKPAAPEAPPSPSEPEVVSAEPESGGADEGEASAAGSDLPEESVAGGGEGPGGGDQEVAMLGPGGPGPGGPSLSPGEGTALQGSSGTGVRLPGFGNPFAPGGGGKGGKFVGYADLVTSEIQRFYKQPAELPENIRLAVRLQLLVDDEGRLLSFKLLTSSGNDTFDQSALQALAGVKQLRPPPAGVSRTLIVKFFPPS